MEIKYGARTNEHGLRPRRPRDHHPKFGTIALQQCGVKKGLKLFGERGTQAVLKELKQVHDCDVLDLKALTTAISCTEESGAQLSDVPEGKTVRKNQGKRLRRR